MAVRDHVARLADAVPLGRDVAAIMQRLESLEHLLENLVRVPGTRRTLGLDVILDIVPVAGDIVAAGLGAYLLWEARNLGLSRWQMTRMAANIGIDMALGAIPWIGAVPDFFFRSNSLNMKIIRRHVARHHPQLAQIVHQGTM